MKKRTKWTKKQTRMLIEKYPTHPDTRVLAKEIGKSYEALKRRAGVLKLYRSVPNSTLGRSILTKKDDQFIRNNFLTIPIKTMANMLGRDDSMIRRRMRQLGIIIPREIIEQRKKDSQIQPGNTPMNKGKRQVEYMSRAAINKTKATRFRKGQIPHNAVGFKNGDISIRRSITRGSKSYKYIRLGPSKWYPLHQYKWEKKYGKLPKGHCLWFKDGNTMNCFLNNLELITRAENVKRNSGSLHLKDGYVAFTIVGKNNMHLYDQVLKDKKLIEAKRLSIQLKRKLHD